jgi:flagellin-like protein
MSEKSERMRQRRQGYRLRQARLRGEKKGISPIVATLILVLIAVAAAAFLYLWLVVWQGNITGGIGQPHAQATLQIGGSTSVYPFSSTAATWFEQNNSDVVISDNQGGTGAGMLAVCAGSVDIGAASSLETASGLIASDGCPSSDLNTIQITTVAYDAVDVIVPVANDHGLVSISYDTLTAIYDGASTTAPTLLNPTFNTEPITSGILDVAPWSTHAALDWNQVPVCVNGVANCGGTGNPTEALATSVGAGAACPVGTDTCATGAGASPCGFTVCGGPFVAIGTVAASDPIVPVERSDASGTTQTFEARVLGATSSSAFATTFAGLGFSGCGSNNLLSDCGISVAKAENGNPLVISTVAGNPDAIGYASDGLTRAATSGVTCQNVATAACGIGLAYPGESVGVAPQPSLGASGSIAGGVVNGGFGAPGLTTTVTVPNSYAGARPFEFVSLQPYTSTAQQFVTFILDPANNIALASATGEVSVYSI